VLAVKLGAIEPRLQDFGILVRIGHPDDAVAIAGESILLPVLQQLVGDFTPVVRELGIRYGTCVNGRAKSFIDVELFKILIMHLGHLHRSSLPFILVVRRSPGGIFIAASSISCTRVFPPFFAPFHWRPMVELTSPSPKSEIMSLPPAT